MNCEEYVVAELKKAKSENELLNACVKQNEVVISELQGHISELQEAISFVKSLLELEYASTDANTKHIGFSLYSGWGDEETFAKLTVALNISDDDFKKEENKNVELQKD